MEISNPSGLSKGLTPEKFGTRSITRNPLLASLFHRAGYIEKMGTGISRIKNAISEANNPEPTFEFDSFFSIIFQRDTEAFEKSVEETSREIAEVGDQKDDQIEIGGQVGGQTDFQLKTGGQIGGQIDDQIGGQIDDRMIGKNVVRKTFEGGQKVVRKMDKQVVRRKSEDGHEIMISENQYQVLLEIKRDPSISRAGLAALLGINSSAVQKHLANLKKNGYIKRVGSDKLGYWHVIKNKKE